MVLTLDTNNLAAYNGCIETLKEKQMGWIPHVKVGDRVEIVKDTTKKG